jgi:hypothetical protein
MATAPKSSGAMAAAPPPPAAPPSTATLAVVPPPPPPPEGILHNTDSQRIRIMADIFDDDADAPAEAGKPANESDVIKAFVALVDDEHAEKDESQT